MALFHTIWTLFFQNKTSQKFAENIQAYYYSDSNTQKTLPMKE